MEEEANYYNKQKKRGRKSWGVSWGVSGGVCVCVWSGGWEGEVAVDWITMAGVQSWLIVSDTLQFSRLISTLFLQL